MHDLRYSLSSQDCELLLAFESAQSLSTLARAVGKDVSVVSRQLQRIAGLSPVLEKVQGRWRLTAVGHELNRWTLESISEQRSLLHNQPVLRLGATRTFAAKALSPNLDFLRRFAPDTALSLVSVEGGIEGALLNAEVDLGFACGKPVNPALAFQRCAPERYIAAASPKFLQRHRVREVPSLASAPHLLLSTTLSPFGFPEIRPHVKTVYAVFNDLLCTIEAALAHHGWGVFPWYAVAGAIERGELRVIPDVAIKNEVYGVWWLRSRKSLKPWADACLSFLHDLRLD